MVAQTVKNFSPFCGNRTFICCVHKSPSLSYNLSHLIESTYNYFKISFNIILPYTPSSHKSLEFPTEVKTAVPCDAITGLNKI